MISITVVSVSMPAITQVYRYADAHRDFGFNIFYADSDNARNLDKMEAAIKNADLLLIDLMGSRRNISSLVTNAAKACKGQRLAVGGMAPSIGRLGGYDAATFRTDDEDEEKLHLIGECWKRAEYEDIDYIFTSVLKNYMGQTQLPDVTCAEIRSGVFIKDPITLKIYDTTEDYHDEHPRDPKKCTVVLVFSGNSYPTRNIDGVRMLFNKIAAFSNVLPVAMNSYNVRFIPQMRELVTDCDIIVNVLPFRFMAGPMGGDSVSATELLREFDVTYLSPFFLAKTTKDEWICSKKGVNPMEFMLSIFLPELDGALCTIPLGFGENKDSSDGSRIITSDVKPLEDRIDRISGKIRSYLRIRSKANHEKKIAILSYNYPPGTGNLFGGSFLNGSGSISSILEMLASEGYGAEMMDADEILNRFLSDGLMNDGDWIEPTDRMMAVGIADEHPKQVTEKWGKAPGSVLTRDGKYLIPGIINGNVFIGLQPPRTSDAISIGQNYHDPDLPPHHQYMAMYEWLENEFKADAIIHLGTHGTVEFLPGKESGMSSDCYPDMLLGNMVHLYVYYSGNPSEAMIAKRRSHAAVISYMPPPFVKSGTYGDLTALESQISEYRESLKVDEGRADMISGLIRKKSEEMRLPSDIDELEDELIEIRESLIPNGLHTVGRSYSLEEAENYAINSMEFPHDEIVPLDESPLLKGCDIEKIYREYNHNGIVPEVAKNDVEICKNLAYEKELIIRSSNSEELTGLKRALEGKFIDVKPGGDSMKDPDILPTGYNMVQFNPYHVPTLAAFERGKQAAQSTLDQYIESTGTYPHSVALVLWGLETSRTQGMTIGQICWYLGLRQVRTSGDFIDRFEVIPTKELGRPRIDVKISMCGFFRDMFPNIVDGLDELFAMVSSLDETLESNYCKEGTAHIRDYLISKGYSGEQLKVLSECRIFGPPRGEYGTTMTGLVNKSEWEDEKELGDAFANSLHYAYVGSKETYDIDGLLNENHKTVDIVTQVRDSKDRELIDLDHYYEFVGGLSKTVETSREGKRATAFIIDGSSSRVKTVTVKRSIERGIRTRLLNPKWIDGLLDIKYHGTQNINDRFENVLGLAATVGEVESSVFSDMLKCYVEDREMRERVRANNCWAYMSMLNRLYEANHRSYWKATAEELNILKEAYIESESFAESQSDRMSD